MVSTVLDYSGTSAIVAVVCTFKAMVVSPDLSASTTTTAPCSWAAFEVIVVADSGIVGNSLEHGTVFVVFGWPRIVPRFLPDIEAVAGVESQSTE